jgi:uncharacterized protein (DUF924 family)
MENPDTILMFWFGSNADAAERSRLWWGKHPETDKLIGERFASSLRKAADGELDDWAATPGGRLALILLTDQFSRNMYRDTPNAFAFDAIALRCCKEGLLEDVDKLLRPIERVFFYLPLEHSESLKDQERSVALLQALAQEAKPDFAGFLDYAIRHRAVIARFGRFPHRNRILGRTSTEQEAAFLKEPGASF